MGSDKNKSDAELVEQASNLDKLGAALKSKGVKLAYHMHDVELRMAAGNFIICYKLQILKMYRYASMCTGFIAVQAIRRSLYLIL